MITAPTLRLDRDPHRRRLLETAKRLRPRLLLLDPLVRLHGIDENNAGEVAGLLAYFRALQRQLDLSVILVHHTRKNAAGRRRRRPGTPRLQRPARLRRLQPLPPAHQGSPAAVQRAPRRPGLAAGLSGTGRDRRPRRPIWKSSRNSTTKPRRASRSRCWPCLPRARCSRERNSATRWASRTSVWARPWSRWSKPAGSAARPPAGNASTDPTSGPFPFPL